MRMLALFGAKSIIAALGSAALTGWLAWLILPISPRSVLTDTETTSIACSSNDCRYFALMEVHGAHKRALFGDLKIWDAHERRLLFSVPHFIERSLTSPRVSSAAFTPSGDRFVTFDSGQAKVYVVPSGDAIEHRVQFTNIHGWSQLVTDPQGNLFVASRIETNTVSVRDFWTGKEAGQWNRSGRIWNICPGGVMEWTDNGEALLREIPGGKIHPTIRPDVIFGMPAGGFLATPDCRTVVQIGPTAELDRNGAAVPIMSTIRVCNDGQEKDHETPAQLGPAISPDGRLFAASMRTLHVQSTWLTALLEMLHIQRGDSCCIVYDLPNESEVARFPNGTNAHFSRDGKTLVVSTGDALEFYDLPLRRPWGWIVASAMIVSGGVFIVAQCFRKRQRKPARPEKRV